MMKVAEALEALRPLLAQRRAIESLHGILEAAHQAEAAMPHIAEKLSKAEKKATEAMQVLAAQRAEAEALADDARKRAVQAEAAAAATIAQVEAEAEEKKKMAEANHAALIAEHQAAIDSIIADRIKQKTDADEAFASNERRLAEINAATVEAEKKLATTQKRLSDLRAKLA